MQLFYTPTIQPDASSYTFDREESKHIIKVLRKKEGDIIHVTNGLGNLFETEIALASDSKCTVTIQKIFTAEKPTYRLHLAVAPTKMNERYEWFLEKATEIGITEITPIICDNSERTVLKIDRMEKIVVAAMKQSNQYFLPKLNEPVKLQKFLEANFSGQKFIAHCEETEKRSLKEMLKKNVDVLVLIGPEGDFSVKEIEMALSKDFIPVTLGATRLRTETAAVIACHSVVFNNE
ncbi:MAG: Ribosomal small subunit methyltransferase [Bacteroidota bacterium]|jgi:16S rRNA (uracil1498-N3)-methyltransferase